MNYNCCFVTLSKHSHTNLVPLQLIGDSIIDLIKVISSSIFFEIKIRKTEINFIIDDVN